MTRSSTGQNLSKTSPSRLGTYLATAVGSCGLATSADGAIVNIDLTNVKGNDITGINGGVASGTTLSIDNWLGAYTGSLRIYNNSPKFGISGASASYRTEFAISAVYASPKNFGSGTTIASSGNSWRFNNNYTLFKNIFGVSADFDAPSFMGFRFGSTSSTWNYGWIEATWNSSTSTFQLLGAAYESTPNTAIPAGATAVPEPSTGALAALVLGGTALGVARRRRKQEAAATTEQAV